MLDQGIVGVQALVDNGKSAPELLLSARIIPSKVVEVSNVGKNACKLRMVLAERPPGNLQGSLQQRLPLGVLAAISIELPQAPHGFDGQVMFQPQGAFADRQGTAQQGFSLGIFTLLEKKPA